MAAWRENCPGQAEAYSERDRQGPRQKLLMWWLLSDLSMATELSAGLCISCPTGEVGCLLMEAVL